MNHFEATTAGGVAQVSDEFTQVQSAMNRILEIFSGSKANSELELQNLRSHFGERIESLEEEKAKALAAARESLEKEKEAEQKLQAAEGMATAYQSIKGQLDEKKAENETLKTQNGDLTAKLKDLPSKDEEINDLRITVARLETENEQLKERLEDYRTFRGVGKIDGGEIGVN
ncbi:hypothetical protein [Pseudobacteriovorax antillogorgiicola]|uniref:Uncharacterized protein n=1 Tax=Pseudobacteriovorax antillogorgiicola TaxID=1513793 RepID=A0A1Y6C3V5_9BACT|nr:hypothetical protein [Pseudobacteriovorax antillogorgiicola]TCS43388.1 hypothetical protein EDD56_13728 [Pseudobacteriovorax antillogorgiicola]SMF34928.1 hypothetical protein SAMN06296036_110180 [Pseudobacteriovorax antillogorgiicola]